MCQRKKAETSDVVAGTFSIFEQVVYVLFDPGSTHSYVSASIVCSATISYLKMDIDVLVTSPLGQEVRVNKLYKDCPLVIQGHTC